MGKAARWLRGLFLGGKKPVAIAEDFKPLIEKKRWGFARSFRDKERGAGNRKEAVAESAVLKERKASYREDDVDEQNKRAIAVAAATAAVAEAAVAAAHAAAAVVRLTASGRSAVAYGSGRNYEEWAAVKIQAVFRGYLARRALKALKGLVKLQALVRGHIVRKQAAQTLRCMQALVRVQARARACRVLPENCEHKKLFCPPYPGPPTPEKYEVTACKKGSKLDRPGILKKNASKSRNANAVKLDKMHSGWNWLDQWMEHRNGDRRESIARTGVATDDEKNDRILEIDTGKPHSHSKRRNNNNQSSCSPLASDQNSRSFVTVPDSPSKDSTTAQFSTPSPSSTVDMKTSLSPLRFSVEAEDLYESPQFLSSSRPGSTRRGAFTPAKSECSQSIFSAYSDYPNYMAYTESSMAKVRSQSAPKQRPDFVERLPVQGLGVQLSSSSSQRLSSTSTHLKFTSKAYPGSGRLDRLGMPLGI